MMSPEALKLLLTTLREGGAIVYKDGGVLIQLAPAMPEFGEPELSPEVQAGGWKRQADMD